MDSFRKFTLVDLMFFELYLFSVGIVLAKLIPAILLLNVWLYVIVVAIWLAIILPAAFKKDWKKRLELRRNFTKFSVWRVGVYKMTVVVAAFLVLILIPIMMTVNIAWYIAIAFFCMGYIMAVMFRKNK